MTSMTSVVRTAGWGSRLAHAIAKARHQTFAWGSFDCALAVCDFVQAMTGYDPGTQLRGKYSTEVEAMKLIGGDLQKFAARTSADLGFLETAPLSATPGAIALVDNGIEPGTSLALGIVSIDSFGLCVLCASPTGLARRRMKHIVRSWKIPIGASQ